MKTENVLITNIEEFEEKKRIFKEQGKEKIQVISDFDRTITKAFVKGMKSSTSWAQFRNKNMIDEDYNKRAHEMFDYYRPIEISTELSKKEKEKKMKEWWNKHLRLLIEKNLSREIIKKVARDPILEFRKDSQQLLEELDKKNIPLIFMSAGMGDILVELLKENNLKLKNIQVISNFLEFNDKGIAIKIKSEVIHALNKKEITLKGLPEYEKLLKRKNVILLGDDLGDTEMAEGFPYENIIKIGFLNENIEERLEEYKKNFDVVITHDEDMKFINKLIKEITK